MIGPPPRRDRGAILTETAIVLPLLFVLITGVIEIGLLVGDRQAAVSASRAGARVVSSAGAARHADHLALQAMAGPLRDLDPAGIGRIIIFRAEPDGSMPPGCETGPTPGACNHYQHADLLRPATDFDGTTSCGASAPDGSWCPTTRRDRFTDPPDWVGVRVEVWHESIVPFIDNQTITDTTYMRVEPRVES